MIGTSRLSGNLFPLSNVLFYLFLIVLFLVQFSEFRRYFIFGFILFILGLIRGLVHWASAYFRLWRLIEKQQLVLVLLWLSYFQRFQMSELVRCYICHVSIQVIPLPVPFPHPFCHHIILNHSFIVHVTLHLAVTRKWLRVVIK